MKASMGAVTALIASTFEELGKSKDELAKVEKSKALDEEYSTKAEKSKVLDEDYSTKLKLDCETKASEFRETKADAEDEPAAIEKETAIPKPAWRRSCRSPPRPASRATMT